MAEGMPSVTPAGWTSPVEPPAAPQVGQLPVEPPKQVAAEVIEALRPVVRSLLAEEMQRLVQERRQAQGESLTPQNDGKPGLAGGRFAMADLIALAQAVSPLIAAFKGPSATPGPGGDMEKVAGVFKSMGEIFQAGMGPLVEIYNRGGRDERERIGTLARTNFTFPWEKPAPSPSEPERPSRIPEAAAAVAGRIVVNVPDGGGGHERT